jgi:regulator of protease activity HflC (stomatin/prohibitin superfamily)
MSQQENQLPVSPSVLFTVIGVILLLIAGSRSYVIVEPGNACIVKRFGKISGAPHGEGMVFLIPFADKPVTMDVRTQKLELEAKAESKDLQSVNFVVALNYHALEDKIGEIYQNIGINYEENIIVPSLREAFKTVTASYNAEELITMRARVSGNVDRRMDEFLRSKGFALDGLSIEDFRFSEKFSDAIERKQVEEQNAKRAEHELKRITTEQQQLVEKAKAEATALLETAKAEATAVTIRAEAEAKALELLAKAAKPDALKARTIEKWNGVLPTVTGGAMPFIDVKEFTENKKKQ